MGYDQLVNTLKSIAITAPAARAFQLTVEFALGEGKDTAKPSPGSRTTSGTARPCRRASSG